MNPKSITLQIEGKEVTVTKLPLRKLAEVFKALDKLPAKLTGVDFQNLNNEKFIEVLPGVIAEVLPEVAKLISIGSTLTEDEVLDEIGLADAIEVLTAMFRVNDFSKVVENVKKLTARQSASKADGKPKTGSTEPLTS